MSLRAESRQVVARVLAQEAATVSRRDVALDNVEVRSDDDKIVFHGHAAVFDGLSEDLGGFRERIQRGAFRKVLERKPDVRLLFNHDPNLVLARSTIRSGPGMLELREDPKGLRTYAELVPTQLAKDLRALVQARVVTQQSFGFRIQPAGKDVWEEENAELIRTIVSFGDLFDVGPVVYPAYKQTDASTRALIARALAAPPSDPRQRSSHSNPAWRLALAKRRLRHSERP